MKWKAKNPENRYPGPVQESNPGPLAPKARIMPLDQQASAWTAGAKVDIKTKSRYQPWNNRDFFNFKSVYAVRYFASKKQISIYMFRKEFGRKLFVSFVR